MKFLIWSVEHRGWWKQSKHGYTSATHRAGLFREDEATDIVVNAGEGEDIMVPAPDGPQVDLDQTCDLETHDMARRIGRVDGALAAQLSRSMKENARLTAQNHTYEVALQKIAQWADAYPEDIFPEPDWKKVQDALRISGITLDSVSAHSMRHVIEGVGKIAKDALNGPS